MAPALAIVGGTGLLGPHLINAFVKHGLEQQKLSSVRVLTSDATNPKLPARRDGIDIAQIDFTKPDTLSKALKGIDILVSAIGFRADKGDYEANKSALIHAAAKAGVQIYVPSEFGTDHNDPAAVAIGSPMFESKKRHHQQAEQLGLRVFAFYTGLFLEPLWGPWLRMDVSVPDPEWVIAKPAHKVAYTSFEDVGRFVLSATTQAFEGAKDIPSRLRLYSDAIYIDDAATWFEQQTGGKITRMYRDTEELQVTFTDSLGCSSGLKGPQQEWDEAKATVPTGMLGPAIPLMMSQGAFDHTINSDNSVILRGPFEFKTKTVRDHFKTLPRFT